MQIYEDLTHDDPCGGTSEPHGLAELFFFSPFFKREAASITHQASCAQWLGCACNFLSDTISLMLFRPSLLTELVRCHPAAKTPSLLLAARQFQSSRAVLRDDSIIKKVVVLAMPMLSPTMTEGSLLRWLKDEGDQLDPYDLVFELETESLTEDAYKVGDFAGIGPVLLCSATRSPFHMLFDTVVLGHLILPFGEQAKSACRLSV